MSDEVINTIFKYIQDSIKDNHSKSLFEFFGDFPLDIKYKNYLNSIIDTFDLINLIEDIWFTDNVCVIKFKNDKKVNFDYKTEDGWVNINKLELLRKAIRFCENKIQKEDGGSDFYIQISVN